MIVGTLWIGSNVQCEWKPCDMMASQIMALPSTLIKKLGISQAKPLTSYGILKLLNPFSPSSHCSLEEGTSL